MSQRICAYLCRVICFAVIASNFLAISSEQESLSSKDPLLEKYDSLLLPNIKNVKILMAAMEYGKLVLNGKIRQARVGGLGSVVNDLIHAMPDFLQKKNASLSFAFMAYQGEVFGDWLCNYDIFLGDRFERVEVFVYPYNGVKLYFLRHPIFSRRSTSHGQHGLYNPHIQNYFSSRKEWEEAYEFALYNRVLERIVKDYNYQIYHGHDFHTALAGYYVPNDRIVALSIHNAGKGYKGSFWTPNFGNERAISLQYPFGIPTGDFLANDYFLRMLGIGFDDYMKYFEYNGSLNILRISRYIGEHNLIWGQPVSVGYACELGNTREQLIQKIRGEKSGQEPYKPEALDLPSEGLEPGVWVGVNNGLSLRQHAKNHEFLMKKDDVSEQRFHPALRAQHLASVRAMWNDDLRYGDYLKTHRGQRQVHLVKARLKAALQEVAGLKKIPDAPMFTLVSRIVDQKNIGVLATAIETITEMGGQIIIGGQPGDDVGEHVARVLHAKEQNPQNKGMFRYFNEFVQGELAILIQAGADFTVVPSKYEPCGLVDVEAAYLGTIPIVRKTGGLGKVQNGMFYLWSDSSDFWGESWALKAKINEAVEFYRYNHDDFLRQRIRLLSEDFSWDRALEEYWQNYVISSLHKCIRKIEEDFLTKTVTYKKATEIIIEILHQLKPNEIEKYVRVLKLKQQFRPKNEIMQMERFVLHRYENTD